MNNLQDVLSIVLENNIISHFPYFPAKKKDKKSVLPCLAFAIISLRLSNNEVDPFDKTLNSVGAKDQTSTLK